MGEVYKLSEIIEFLNVYFMQQNFQKQLGQYFVNIEGV